MRKASLILVSLCFFFTAFAANISTTTKGGAWNDASTWKNGIIPSSGDNVTIKNSASITIPEGLEVTCTNLTSGGNISGGGILNITNTWECSIANAVSGSVTINVGKEFIKSKAFIIADNAVVNIPSYTPGLNDDVLISGTLNIEGDFLSSTTNTKVNILDGGLFYVNGNVEVGDPLETFGSGYFHFTGNFNGVGNDADISLSGSGTSIIEGNLYNTGTSRIGSGTKLLCGEAFNSQNIYIENGGYFKTTLGGLNQTSANNRFEMLGNGEVILTGTSNNQGIVIVGDQFTSGTFNNTTTGVVTFKDGLVANFTGNMENYAGLNFGTNGNLVFNMLNNSVFKTYEGAHTIACNSALFNGNFYTSNDILIAIGTTYTVTGYFLLDDSETGRNVFDLDGTGVFNNITLLNDDLEDNAVVLDAINEDNYYKTDFQIAGNATFNGAILFDNSSTFSNATTFQMSPARILIESGQVHFNDQLILNTGYILGDMSAFTNNIFNAIDYRSTTPLTWDGQIIFGQALSDNYIETRGGNFLLVNHSGVNITFTHLKPFVNYQGGLRTDETYLFGALNTDADITFQNDANTYTFPNHFNNSFPDVFFRGSVDTVVLEANTYTNQLKGTFYIGDDAYSRTLKIYDEKNFDALETSSYGSLNIGLVSACKYLLYNQGIEDGIPETDRLIFAPTTIFEFQNTTSAAKKVLSEKTSATYHQYPRVYLSGAGEKILQSGSEFSNSINPNHYLDYVWLQEGVLTIEEGAGFELTNFYGYNNTFIVNDYTTVNIEGDFLTGSPLANANFKDRHTNFNYNGTNKQVVYPFYQNGAKSGLTLISEPYDILSLSNTVSEISVNEDVQIGTRLDLENNTQTTLNPDGYLHLLSTSAYTAYISEITDAESITLNYNGGSFIVEKYQTYNGYSAPDLSSPIVNQNLKALNKHVQMRGFPGSDKPTNRFSSVSYYDERLPGQQNNGFSKPNSIDQSYFSYQNNYVVSSAFRINIDPSTFTLADTGEVRLGKVQYAISFNHDPSTNADREVNDGLNLIGNPYPAPLSLTKIFNDVNNTAISSLEPTVYIYQYFDNVSNGENMGYSTYNPYTGVSTGAGSDLIPSHAAFWIKLTEPIANNASYTFEINESHKYDYENSLNLKSKAKSEVSSISLWVNDSLQDLIYTHTWPKSSALQYDQKVDTKKITNKRVNSINFADEAGNNLNLLVNAFSATANQVYIPLNISLNKPGTFSLVGNFTSQIAEAYSCLLLYDAETQQYYSLSEKQTFISTVKEIKNRFKIIGFKNIETYAHLKLASCAKEASTLVLQQNPSWETLILQGPQQKEKVITTLGNYKLLPGNYVLTIPKVQATCPAVKYSFEIPEIEALYAQFDDNTVLFQQEGTILHLNTNAAKHTLLINNELYNERTFKHLFSATGKHKVEVLLSTENGLCTSLAFLDIEVLNKGFSNDTLKANLAYTIQNASIVLNQNVPALHVHVFNQLGVEIRSEKLEETNTIRLSKGLNIYEINTAQSKTTVQVYY